MILLLLIVLLADLCMLVNEGSRPFAVATVIFACSAILFPPMWFVAGVCFFIGVIRMLFPNWP